MYISKYAKSHGSYEVIFPDKKLLPKIKFPSQVEVGFLSAKLTPRKFNSSPPENRPKPKRKGSSSNHPFFRGENVSFLEGNARCLNNNSWQDATRRFGGIYHTFEGDHGPFRFPPFREKKNVKKKELKTLRSQQW